MPDHHELENTAMRALCRAGVPETEARIQVDLLMEAELRGVASHGFLRLPRVIERIENGVTSATATGEHDWVGEALLRVDGDHGLGPVVALNALEAAAARLDRLGSVTVAIRNCDHLGMLAFYAERMAAKGHVMLGFTISEALVHPHGGRKAMIGTNPIAIGVPAQPEPFVVDLATSLVSMGKIHDHANRGAAIPEGWARDENGDPTTDADAAKAGAIAPFGGAKGYALGLGFELMVAALCDSALGTDVAGTLDSTAPCNKGDVFVLFAPQSGTAERLGHYLDALRHSPPAEEGMPVRIPGDRARQNRASRAGGEIVLPDEIWNRIRTLAGERDHHSKEPPHAS